MSLLRRIDNKGGGSGGSSGGSGGTEPLGGGENESSKLAAMQQRRQALVEQRGASTGKNNNYLDLNTNSFRNSTINQLMFHAKRKFARTLKSCSTQFWLMKALLSHAVNA